MLARRLFVVLPLCLLASACLTSSHLNHRPLNSGAVRDYEAPFVEVAGAVDGAMETLRVNLSDPVQLGSSRVTYFERPSRATNFGAYGRVVITPLGIGRTRVTVAVEKRYRLQIGRAHQDDFAVMIFTRTQQRLDRS